jgi:hypothetical protein
MSEPEQLDNAGLCMELQNSQGSGRKGVPFGRNTFPKEFAANQLAAVFLAVFSGVVTYIYPSIGSAGRDGTI